MHTRPELPTLYGNPGGVSWQARLLNRLFRHFVKHPARSKGLSPRTTRNIIRMMELIPMGWGDLATVHQKTVAGIPCDVVYPLNPPAKEKVVLYVHGGGFFVHLPRSYKRFARRLSEALGATVYMPAYRLAPEHRYPAATDDCLAVYAALLEEGCDPRSMAIMGDSAGGNLALVTLLRIRDSMLPLPSCATLISPGVDLTLSGESFKRNAELDPFIPIQALLQVVEQYADADQLSHPYVSPMLSDLSGLPPLKILVGSTEVLLDSSVTTAENSRQAGGNVMLQVWRDMPHVFPMFSHLPEAKLALAYIAEFFNTHAAQTTAAPPGHP